MKITVQRDTLIPAASSPDDHWFYWAVNPSYTSKQGSGMMMTTVKWISNRSGEWRRHRSVIQRMTSDDNGHTWHWQDGEITSGSFESKDQIFAPHHFLDPDNDLLLSVYQLTQPGPEDCAAHTTLHYQISADRGMTWSKPQQIIQRGEPFNDRHWMAGMDSPKRYIGMDQPTVVKLDDGTIVFGLVVLRHAPNFPHEQLYYGVVFLRGRWRDDLSGLTWEAGDYLRVPSNVSPYGVDEPDLVHLGGQRLLTTMRCEGQMEPLGLFTTRQWAMSEDGGRTWSEPRTLCYEDGGMVCVPASLAAFEKDPRTGRIYWFANVLDRAITCQMPRYPLTIAELDPAGPCLIRDSVTVIQDLPPGAPANRSYSNFGHYVDRRTGEFVLMMAEKPMINDHDFRADTIRFRIKVHD